VQTWLVNGRLQNAISLDDRGLAYGDGLFETIAWRRGQPRFFDRHLARLREGCRRLDIPAPPDAAIADEIGIAAAGSERGTVKIIVTRGCGRRGYAWEADIVPSRIVGFDPAPAEGRPAAGGASVVYCDTPASCNPRLAGLKTLNRLDNVIARAELRGRRAEEGLMFDDENRLVGGTMSNLFVVRNRELATPLLDRAGVRGVMRDVVMERAREAGIACREIGIARSFLESADEIFLTNALTGLRPVTLCGSSRLEAGPVTATLRAALLECGVEECAA
jgi:4-amino-4-deoxychorismate lyase